MRYRYPNHEEISDPTPRLPADVRPALERMKVEFQKRYRALRRQPETALDTDYIQVLADIGVETVRILAAREQTKSASEMPQFRKAIAQAGEIGMEYAHWLYNDVDSGRMLWKWQERIEPRIDDAIQELEDQRWIAAPAAEPTPSRKAPEEYFLEYRAKNPGIAFDQIAARVGIARDSIFKIKGERAWVRDEAYRATAEVLGCRPEDLYPRHLTKLPRQVARKKSD